MKRVLAPAACWLLLAVIAGCGDKQGSGDTGVTDADRDGFDSTQDCDDGDAAINPGATEVCDGVDNDCDALVDDADDSLDLSSADPAWLDADRDGYGDASSQVLACALPVGAVANPDDCDDTQPTVNPGAAEICDGLDNDCDGLVDDQDPEGVADAPTWYADRDGDGFGDPDAATVSCTQPDGTAADGTDCDDGSAWVWPGNTEVCDGLDNDCDDSTLEAATASWEAAGALPVDVTAAVSGSEGAPAAWAIDDPGTLRFCDGTFHVSLDVGADTTVLGVSGDPTATVLDAGGSGSVVQIEGEGLAVSLSGLTLTGGVGELSFLLGEGEGGGVLCESLGTPSSLSLDRVHVEANAGLMAGALFTHNCDTTLRDSDLASNEAQALGGAGWVVDGSHTWTDVAIYDNSTGGDIAGVYFQEYLGALSVLLDEVEVYDNRAEDGVAGGLAAQGGTLTWSGTAKTASGARGNLALDEGGALHLSRTAFSAEGVDFGEDGSAEDNRPHDIWLDLPRAPYAAGDDATFSCDEDSCGRTVTHEVGGDDTEWVMIDGHLTGDIFLADRAATIEGFRMWGSLEDGCQATGVVLSATAPAEETAVDWTIEWQGSPRTWGTSPAWYELGEPEVLTSTGRTYALGFICTCDGGTFCYGARDTDEPTTRVDSGFGDGTGMLFQSAFDGEEAWYYGSSFASWLALRIDVTEL